MVAANTLEVGLTEDGTEIVINHPDLQPDANGVGHIIFSPAQALGLANTLYNKVYEVESPPAAHAMDPQQMLEDSMLWARAKFPAVAVGRYREAAERIKRLTLALEESVKLQSHYANLLNMHDGGQRVGFSTVQAWLDRLAEMARRPR